MVRSATVPCKPDAKRNEIYEASVIVHLSLGIPCRVSSANGQILPHLAPARRQFLPTGQNLPSPGDTICRV